MTWKPDIFIYHANCDDGFGAAWAVHQRWGDAVEYIPASYGEAPPDPSRLAGKRILIGDFSYKRGVLEAIGTIAQSVVVLDHHKTAEQELSEVTPCLALGADDVHNDLIATEDNDLLPVVVRFDMTKCGARLVWEFCHPGDKMPDLLMFIEDRDLWLFNHPSTRAFSLFLRSHPYDFRIWTELAEEIETDRDAVLAQAEAVERFYNQQLERILEHARFTEIAGHRVPIVNAPYAFASDAAHQLLALNPDLAFAASYFDRADGKRQISLRSDDQHLDVSAIAEQLGGGGHRNAAGYELAAPPEQA
jgi:oligoribonuclease NrnB/cAMP/cGMP phosphodiesterase (DHH superfamily)